MIENKFFTTEHIDDWAKLLSWYSKTTQKGDQWIFRGLSNSSWGFDSSLERSFKNYGLDSTLHPISRIEGGLIKRFMRQSHHYLNYLPEEDNILEWLSVMQHYGAPTRLLDWTHSLFVALFFAVEQANGECIVWALKHEWVVKTAISLLPKSTQKNFEDDRNIRKANTFNNIFKNKSPVPLVLPVKPYKLNERLIIQQGTFLCQGDISKSFEDNLTAVLSQSKTGDKLIKLVIKDSSTLRQEILKNLNRMNMNAATLYPGLVGFAQSLRTMMIQPEILRP